jgi:hypothetical protein
MDKIVLSTKVGRTIFILGWVHRKGSDALVSDMIFSRGGVGSPNLKKQLKFLFSTSRFGSLNLVKIEKGSENRTCL